MATNPFFDTHGHSLEQSLLDDLLEEAIQIHGIDFYYLPRTLNKLDKIYMTDDLSTFEDAYPCEMYVNWAGGFQGGSFMTQFNLEIRDQLNFMISRTAFQKNIGSKTNFVRPREGDLLYYPHNKKFFEIKFVEDKPIHYPLGFLPVFELNCDLIESTDQRFSTGIEELDDIQEKLSRNLYDYALTDENGNALVDDDGNLLLSDDYDLETVDPFADNDDFKEVTADIIDFTEENPFGFLDDPND